MRVPSSCPTCPSVPVTVLSCRQRLTWPTSAPFRARALRPISGRWPGTRPGGVAQSSRFPGAFRRSGVGFLGHPVPAEEFRLPHGRPTEIPHRTSDLDGVSTFHLREMRPGRAPPLPRGGGAHSAGPYSPAVTCRFSAASPAPQRNFPSPGFDITRHHRGFTHVRPSGLPLTCNLRMERRSLDLNPELRTPPLPATHVKAGTGHRALAQDYTTDMTSASNLRVHSLQATSCRT